MNWNTLKLAWRILDHHERRRAWLVLVVMIISALSAALMVGSILPFLSVLSDPSRIETVPLLSWAFETFDFETRHGFLVALGVASLAVIVISNAVQIFKVYAVARFSQMRIHAISYRLLRAYLRRPYEYFLDHNTGSLGTNILSESTQVVGQCFTPAANMIASALTVIAIVGLVLWVDPVIASFAFLVFGGLYAAIYRMSHAFVDRMGKQRLDTNQARFRIANEALSGIKEIKLLGRERSYLERFCEPSLRMARSQVATSLVGQLPHYAMQSIAFGGVILMCLLLLKPASLESGNALGEILPLLGTFAFAGQKIMPELSTFYRGFVQINYARATVRAIHCDLMAAAAPMPESNRPPAPLGLRQTLTLDRITYNYPNAKSPAITDVSVIISAGERIGIVGSTGAGKTTLADILLGLLPPASGCLLIDACEITPDNVRAWQQTAGYVPQDIFLTDASLLENIALGVHPSEIDQARAKEAGRIAQIDTFVREELPEGYGTIIGERGVRLSGGQRQRIGIARALYHDADLIVFDEATSALDNLTEREVMASIDALPDEKTVVMIAHRLSTVRRCDRILVMEQGRLVGCDTWEALMTDSPAFQRIARTHEAA